MPVANSAPILSNPPARYPRIVPQPAQKPDLLDRLREALRLTGCKSSYTVCINRCLCFSEERYSIDIKGF
jgi:hypothetical protein